MSRTHRTTSVLRRSVLGLMFLGLGGMTIELLLLGHYEHAWQIAPFGAIGLALVVMVWHVRRGSAASVRVLQVVMSLLVFTGLVGIVLHYQGNMEFQVDIDPSQSAWSLFTRVIRAKAPPALAPGAMTQLGLLGLAYAYRHPATANTDTDED